MDDKVIFDTVVDMKNRKKSPFEVVKKSFIQVDAATLAGRLWKKKIVPGLKDLVLSGIAMVFYDNDSYSSKSSNRYSDDVEDYTRYSRSKYSFVTDTRREPKKTITDDIPDYRRMPAVTLEDGTTILRNMREALRTHTYVTVDSFYTLYGYTSTDPIDQEWGWDAEHFASARTKPAPRGLVYLDIPDAIKIKLR